jgi:hypothetical protein
VLFAASSLVSRFDSGLKFSGQSVIKSDRADYIDNEQNWQDNIKIVAKAVDSQKNIASIVTSLMYFCLTPEPEGRSNPHHAVKKTRAKVPSKKPVHRGQGAKLETLTFSILNTAYSLTEPY